MSLGGATTSSSISAAIEYALGKGVVVVAAAGNEAPCQVEFPASINRVIAVGATTKTNELASFSCTGTALDLVAPGKDIYSLSGVSTIPMIGDGTSFSAPMVSGVAALIRSINPAMSVDDVTRYIDFFATDLGSPGFDTTFGFGLLNASASLHAVQANAPLTTNPASQNETFSYPNPFNPALGSPATFSIPASLSSDNFRIRIMNMNGERIKTLTNTNTWDGRNDDGLGVASGLYFYYVETAKGHIKGKLTVIK
jgi:subtilisin family serine protease